jgi:CRP/FNR family cyclic AMP-dependent transcriptional regulator
VSDVADRAAALLRSYLFEGLDLDDIDALAAASTVRRLVRGEYLCRVGDAAGEIYVIQSGEVKDVVVNEDGEEVVHFVHGPGMTLGEAGFFAVERTRIVEVVAMAPTSVISVHRRDLVPFMERHGVVKDRALEGLASNTRWQTAMISTLTTRPLVNRLVMRLLELVDSSPQTTGTAMTPKISQATLAAMIGASRENVNRALALLVAQGYLRRVDGRYVLVDEAGLRSELARDLPLVGRRDRRFEPDRP